MKSPLPPFKHMENAMNEPQEKVTCRKISEKNDEVQRWRVTVPLLDLPFNKAVHAAGPYTSMLTAAQRAEKRARAESLSKLTGAEREERVRTDVILSESLIWEAAPLYEETPQKCGRIDIVLANLRSQGAMSGPHVVHWAKSFGGYVTASPHEVFSVGAYLPHLYRVLRSDPAGILSTDERLYDGVWRACCVWLGTAQQEIAFVPFRYPLHDSYWFAFTEEKKGI